MALSSQGNRNRPEAGFVTRDCRVFCGALLTSVAVAGGTSLSGVAWAAQTDIAISMTSPPAAPRLLGPSVVAAKPASAFLYAVPATGQTPLTFAATGLPAGLTLATATGTIAGTTPAAGSYSVMVTVSNAAGSAQAALTLVSGDTLSLTPPMGWNSYDSFGASVTESEVMAAAQAQKAQLQPFGWNYVVVDFRWFDPEDVVDSNGRYLPSPTHFPSATGTLGFKPLADKVHALGLSFGIHIMRGIPRKSVTANSPIAGSAYTASGAANTSDACPWDTHMWGVNGATAAGQAWYNSIFAQYAQWGIDFVKVDDMLNNTVTPLVYHQAEVDAIRMAIDASGRSIVLSLSPGPMQTADAVDLNANANMWRMVNDFWDVNGLSTLPDVFAASGNWQAQSGLGAGHWPDGDMLPLGYLGPRCPVHASGPTALSHNQQVTVLSLWSILPSPLIFGGNVPALTTDATGPWTVALLTNEEVLAVNQDALGTHAKRVLQQGTTEVWSRDLSGSRKAVALFNRSAQDATVSVTFSQLGVSGAPLVRDLWHRMDVTGMTTGLSVNVPHDGALMYMLSPASTGAGDAGADGSTWIEGGAPTDANAGNAGSDGGGGPSGGAGHDSGGSAAFAEGGAGATDSGGGTGSDTDGASGGGPGEGARPSSSSGCGCELGPAGATRRRTPHWMLFGLAVMGLAVRRQRRR